LCQSFQDQSWYVQKEKKENIDSQWGNFYLFIADLFATRIIGVAKELVGLL